MIWNMSLPAGVLRSRLSLRLTNATPTASSSASAFTWLTPPEAEQLLGHEHFVRASAGYAGPTFLDALEPSSGSVR